MTNATEGALMQLGSLCRLLHILDDLGRQCIYAVTSTSRYGDITSIFQKHLRSCIGKG